MIKYESSGRHHLSNIFKLRGSVFPFSLKIALPAAFLSMVLKALIEQEILTVFVENIVKDNEAWNGFNKLVGSLVVFRTGQAYNRFWDGCKATHRIFAEWFDAVSCIIAFCKASTAEAEVVMRFQHTLIRLFSMLHAVALAEIENTANHEDVSAFKMHLIDPIGIGEDSLKSIKDSPHKVALILMWIQQLLIENIKNGVLVIHPAILSRAFNVIANGMVAFYKSMQISQIPFPFPYAQTCDYLLCLHWLICPVVVAQWTSHIGWAGVFTFIQVFILWALNSIAVEIENPFGGDANDINAAKMQRDMNRHLLLLLRPDTARTPSLSSEAKLEEDEAANPTRGGMHQSFLDVWNELRLRELNGELCPRNNRISMPISTDIIRRTQSTDDARTHSTKGSKQSLGSIESESLAWQSYQRPGSPLSSSSSPRNSPRSQEGPGRPRSPGRPPPLAHLSSSESQEHRRVSGTPSSIESSPRRVSGTPSSLQSNPRRGSGTPSSLQSSPLRESLQRQGSTRSLATRSSPRSDAVSSAPSTPRREMIAATAESLRRTLS